MLANTPSASLLKFEDYRTPRFSSEHDLTMSTECKTPTQANPKIDYIEEHFDQNPNRTDVKKELCILLENVFFVVDRKAKALQSSLRLRSSATEFIQQASENFKITILTTKNKQFAKETLLSLRIEHLVYRIFAVDPERCEETKFLTEGQAWENSRVPLDSDSLFLTAKDSCNYFFEPARMITLDPYYKNDVDSSLLDLIPFLNYYAQLEKPSLSVDDLRECFEREKDWQKYFNNSESTLTDGNDESCLLSEMMGTLKITECSVKTKLKLK